MKKLLLTVVAVTTALFLMSCDHPNSDSENENSYDDYNKPSLPETVGEDPFKGNTYASDHDKWVFSENSSDKFSRYIRDENNKMPISELLDSVGNENLISAYIHAIKFINKLYGTEYNWKKTVNVILAVMLVPLYVIVFCPTYSIYNLCTKKKISEQIESVNEHNPAIPRIDQNINQNNERNH